MGRDREGPGIKPGSSEFHQLKRDAKGSLDYMKSKQKHEQGKKKGHEQEKKKEHDDDDDDEHEKKKEHE